LISDATLATHSTPDEWKKAAHGKKAAAAAVDHPMKVELKLGLHQVRWDQASRHGRLPG
jgi:hypothetical protein